MGGSSSREREDVGESDMTKLNKEFAEQLQETKKKIEQGLDRECQKKLGNFQKNCKEGLCMIILNSENFDDYYNLVQQSGGIFKAEVKGRYSITKEESVKICGRIDVDGNCIVIDTGKCRYCIEKNCDYNNENCKLNTKFISGDADRGKCEYLGTDNFLGKESIDIIIQKCLTPNEVMNSKIIEQQNYEGFIKAKTQIKEEAIDSMFLSAPPPPPPAPLPSKLGGRKKRSKKSSKKGSKKASKKGGKKSRKKASKKGGKKTSRKKSSKKKKK